MGCDHILRAIKLKLNFGANFEFPDPPPGMGSGGGGVLGDSLVVTTYLELLCSNLVCKTNLGDVLFFRILYFF